MRNIYLLLSILVLLWEFTPVEAQNTDLNRFFTFEIPNTSGNIPPYTPYKVRVSLKTDFSGTVKFYSCDKSKFRLLDIGNAEYAENVTYDVNAKPGSIAKFDAEFYGVQSGTQPLICGEYSGANQLKGTRYAAVQTNREIFRPGINEDWYDTNLLDALVLLDTFAQARTKKLLTNFYPPEKAKSILPDLVTWIIKGDQNQRAESTFKMIVAQYGGKEAAEALKALLKDPVPDNRRKALELLSFCGKDADIASNDVQELLLTEKEEDVLRDAILLAKNRGFEIPAKYLNLDDISADTAAAHKKEIKNACDFAATVDVSENDRFHRWDDDNGKRIPPPENAQKAISSLENLITRMPNYPEMARCYLLLGKLRYKYQDQYHALATDDNRNDAPPAEIAEFANQQYFLYESALIFYYNGWHYDRLISLFPNSDLVDDAAYEKTNTQWMACEGDENCEIDSGITPFTDFLTKYPTSDLASKAILRITKEFSRVLSSKGDRISGTEYFSIGELKASIAKFENATKSLNTQEKVVAYDVISTLWEKTGETEKAADACNFILKNYPAYPSIAEVKLRAQNFRSINFRLKPPLALGYRSVYLEWEPVNDAISYTIYRATANSDDFSKIQLLSGTTNFQDKSIAPKGSYTYYIEALTPNGAKLTSNSAFTDIPTAKNDAWRDSNEPTFERMAFFNVDDRGFYIFTHIYNSHRDPFPEVTRISEDGKDVQHFSGMFYGYSDSPLNGFTDSTLLIDPTHQKFLRFPKDTDFGKSIAVIRTQNMGIIPDSSKGRKWQPEKGRHIVSLSHDNKSAWVINISTDYWSKHDSFVWDSVNNLGWEIRGGNKLIQYKSQDPAQVSLFNPEVVLEFRV